MQGKTGILVGLIFVSFFTFCNARKGNEKTNREKTEEPAVPPAPEGHVPQEPEVEKEVGKDCVDKSKIDNQAVCYDLYDPVCGCNGITYSNDCEARKRGVLKWTKGPCTGQ